MIDDIDGIDWTVLSRYLAGECSAADTAAVEQWIAAGPAHAALLDELRRLWAVSATLAPTYDVERALRVAHARRTAAAAARAEAAEAPPMRVLRARVARSAPRLPPTSRAPRWHRWAAAALIVAAAGVGAGVWRLGGLPRALRGAPVAMREVVTKRGQRADVYLSDGTHVVLGVASRLRYVPLAGARARTVYLDGEAYFDVRHDAAHPFIVHTAAGTAEDLGTTFLVRSYAGDSSVRVVVASGRVALRPAADSARPDPGAHRVTLGAGDLGEATSAGAITVTHGVDAGAYLAWTRGQITFQRTPLAQVLRDLERWYDLRITLTEPSLAATPVTASFEGQSADDVLGILAGLLDMRYRRDGAAVELSPKRRTP
jgi:transmembrane sensor